MILADKIMMLRKKNGWSQEELAEKLNVTRQSISKWEGAQSVPDLDKILKLSQIFEVSTDFLLKDEMEVEDYAEAVEVLPEMSRGRKVSMEEANAFLRVCDSVAGKIAFAVGLCILSPVCLIMLPALAEGNVISMGENAAALIGLVMLILMVVPAVAIFIMAGSKLSPYEYMELEPLDTEYGVTGMVRERKEAFRDTFTRYNVIGVCLCILSVIPILCVPLLTEAVVPVTMTVILLLVLVAIAVQLFIRGGMRWGSYQKLLEEGDYSKENKLNRKRNNAWTSAYWLVVTAIYLGSSFITGRWDQTWIIWPVAGVLFAAITVICNEAAKRK